jgi:diguanylate cyclase (GGDEF)-like protein
MPSSKLLAIQLLEKVNQKDGLPSHQIHSLCYSNRKLWLSTPNGLAVYDGEKVEILNQTTGLLTHGQRSVVSHNELIIASSDLGLNIINAKNATVLKSINTVENALGWCQCSLMIEDNKFLLGCGNGLYLWDSNSNNVTNINTYYTGEGVLNLVQSPDNLVLIQMSQSGILTLKDGVLEPLLKHGATMLDKIENICVSSSGFYITSSQSILCLDFELNLKEQILLPCENKAAIKVVEQKTGLLIVADNEKIYQLLKRDGDWSVGEKICDNVKANDLCIDHLNNLWIATESSGLYKYSMLNQYIQYFSSTKNESVLAIRSSENNRNLLIAGAGASYIIVDSAPQVPVEIYSLKHLTCWDIFLDTNQAIWAASNKGLVKLKSLQQSEPTFFQSKDVGQGRCLQVIGTDILYGSVYGLFKFNTKTEVFSAVRDNNGNALSYVYSLVRKSSSQFFVTTLGRSLWIYDSDTDCLSQVKLLNDYRNIYDIDCDENKRCVIAAENKILILENNELKVVCESTDSIAAWTCRWYSDTQIILGTPRGLRIHNIVGGKLEFQINNIPSHQFWEFTTSRSLLKYDGNQYWCGLNEGLVLAKLDLLFEMIEPPTPEVKSINCSVTFEQENSSIVIAEGNWNIEIELRSYWLWDEKSAHYLYRLVGFHDDWRQVQAAPIIYSSLPAGDYVLEIKVINSLTQSNQNYQLLSVKVSKTDILHNMLNYTKRLLHSLVNKLRLRRNFWKLYENNLELERIVKRRTRDLSLANQQLQAANQSLEKLSNRDQLTGLYNRRAFTNFTDEELKRACRTNAAFSILMIDIDYFKPFNDNYGHLAGDICLKKVAECLSGCIHRTGDLLARYGGEEFIIALPEADLSKAQQLASICVNSIRKIAIKHEFSMTADYVTISVGVASSRVVKGLTYNNRAQFLTELIGRADDNLYKAKEKGRNQFMSKALAQHHVSKLDDDNVNKTT